MFRQCLIKAIIFCGLLSKTFAGFYVGPKVAYIGNKAGNVSYDAWTINATLGYRDIVWDYVILGGELFGGLTSFPIKNHPNNVGSLRTTYIYGISLLPGYIFDDVFTGFVRLGYARTRFDNVGLIRTGFQKGVGLDYKFAPCWSFRGEYINTQWQSIRGIGSPGTDEFAIGLVYSLT